MNEREDGERTEPEQSSSPEQKITAVDEAGVRPAYQTSADADPLIGQLFSRKYRILSQLGRGGMSCVYKAIDVFLNRVVALKILLPNLMFDMNGIMRFQQEARSASHLNNPHIIKIYEFSVPQDSGAPFLVMDYVDGITLSELISKTGTVDVDRAAALFMQTCDGLMHAHDNGVIHRDLKPSNLMITKTSFGEDFVNIVDFGIAKMMLDDEAVQLHLTQTGEVFGSPYYMSPEQCRGEKLDGRSDIYSLGCVMYEALTGRVPFKARNVLQTIHKHLSDAPEPFADANPGHDIPVELEQIVLKALTKSPDERYQSMHDLYDDLKTFTLNRALAGQTTGNLIQQSATGNIRSADAQPAAAGAGMALTALTQTTPPAQQATGANHMAPAPEDTALPAEQTQSLSATGGVLAAQKNSTVGVNVLPTRPFAWSRPKILTFSAIGVLILAALAGAGFVLSPSGAMSIARYIAACRNPPSQSRAVGAWLEGHGQFEAASLCYLATAKASLVGQPEVGMKELRQSIKALVELKSVQDTERVDKTIAEIAAATAPGTTQQIKALAAIATDENNAKRYAVTEIACRLAIAIMEKSPASQSSEMVQRLLTELQECYLNQSRYGEMFESFGSIKAELDSTLKDKRPVAFCLWSQATAKFELQDSRSAQPLYDSAVTTLKETGAANSEELAAILYDQGKNFVRLKSNAQAAQCFRDALTICESLRLTENVTAIRQALAQTEGEEASANRQHTNRLARSRPSGGRHGISRILSRAKHWFGF